MFFQVLVDISTPAEVFEAVDVAVSAHFKANPKEYTGEKLVVANGATDPLKVQSRPDEDLVHIGSHIIVPALTPFKQHFSLTLTPHSRTLSAGVSMLQMLMAMKVWALSQPVPAVYSVCLLGVWPQRGRIGPHVPGPTQPVHGHQLHAVQLRCPLPSAALREHGGPQAAARAEATRGGIYIPAPIPEEECLEAVIRFVCLIDTCTGGLQDNT